MPSADLFVPIDPFNGEVEFSHSLENEIYTCRIFYRPTRSGWVGQRTVTEFYKVGHRRVGLFQWQSYRYLDYQAFEPARMQLIETGLRELEVIQDGRRDDATRTT